MQPGQLKSPMVRGVSEVIGSILQGRVICHSAVEHQTAHLKAILPNQSRDGKRGAVMDHMVVHLSRTSNGPLPWGALYVIICVWASTVCGLLHSFSAGVTQTMGRVSHTCSPKTESCMQDSVDSADVCGR